MPKAKCRIASHAIDIGFAVRIGHVGAMSARNSHIDGMIVVRAVAKRGLHTLLVRHLFDDMLDPKSAKLGEKVRVDRQIVRQRHNIDST